MAYSTCDKLTTGSKDLDKLDNDLSHVVPLSDPNDSIEVLSTCTAFQRSEVVLVMLHSTYYANISNAREVAQS